MAGDLPLLERLARLPAIPAADALRLLAELGAPHRDPVIGGLFGVDDEGDQVVSALVPAVLQQFQDKADLTCYTALLEGLTGIWNAAVRAAVVGRLRAAGLPPDDLLLRLQALSPTLGFAKETGDWARQWLADPGAQDGLLVQQCIVRVLFALRGLAEARGRELTDHRSRSDTMSTTADLEPYRDLFAKKSFAHLATVGADGAPQVTPVWMDVEGGLIRVNTARGRVKDRNLRRNPRVALSIQDPDDPYRYVQVRGRVTEMTEQGADAHIDALARKYLGLDRYPHRRPGEVRILIVIAPERVQAMGSSGAVLVQLEGVTKSYGARVLFREVSWRIQRGERIGLVGPNGAGKTTLCRILTGAEDADTGRLSRPRDVTVGYLPQEVAGSGAGTVLEEALSGFEAVWALEREMAALGAALAGTPSEALTARYGDVQHRFEALGGYRLENEARAVLSGLGFAATDLGRPLTEFSGGWRMRAALARLLLLRPPLLLLDEPTNHLDMESLVWLEGFLSAYEGAVVVVSHDRYFLNRMVTSIAELGPAGLTVYPGDYDDYLVERDARRELREAQARNQAKRVAEIERFIERFRYKATKARQVQSRVKMLARLERVTVDGAARAIRFAFPEPPRTGRRVAALRGIRKAYGPNVVYAGVDLEVHRGERVALVGLNGAGKSTLLRILAGVLPFDAGERTLGANVAEHYYAQHQLDALDPARTVLEELTAAAPEAGGTRLRTVLGSFLFSGDDVDKKVAVLSGGEKARLALARMLVRPAALLCLDEPTNHLDLASREVLEEALAGFPGTIVFISHDRYFINRIATSVVEVSGGALTAYPGAYDDYLAARARTEAPMPEPVAVAAQPSGRRRDRGTPAASPPRAADKRRLGEVEREIGALEERLRVLGDALGDPALYADGERARAVTQERKQAEEQMAGLLHEWETLSTALADRD